MSEKRYFKIEYDEEWYLFDSTTISEQLVKEQAEYGYGVFANSLSPLEIVDLLNELSYENNILNKNEEDLKECTIENIKLKEENEQLRQGFNELLAAHTKIVETLDSEFVSKALKDGD